MSEFSTVELLYSLQRQGIILWCADGEKINYSSNAPIPDTALEKIKKNKQSLIHFLADKNIVKPYQIPHIFSLNSTKYPLSPAQERLWFLAQLQEKNNYIYNEPLPLSFDGQCDPDSLRRTIKTLVERHRGFRTLFKKDVNGAPIQIILPPQDNRVKLIYALNVENIDDQDLPKHLDTRIKTAFDLSKELSIRCYLYYLKRSNTYVLYILQHHIITDGTSIGLFLDEFYTTYNKLLNKEDVNLPEIDIQYSDYALWFREYYKKDNLENQLSYWKNKLEGFQKLQIQTDNPKASGYLSSTYKYEIDPILFDSLKELSKKNKTTLFVSLLAAFYILLNRYSNQNDIVVGTPVNGRNLKQIKNILGFFINTIALRAKIENQRVCDFLLDINQLYVEGLKHQDLPFELLVNSMDIHRGQDLSPIFQVLFAYQKFIVPSLETDNSSWFDNNFSDAATKFDITFDFKETDTKLIASIQYKANLFLSDTIERMSNHYVNVLRQMVEFPEHTITELNILTKSEYNNIVYKWNSTTIPYLKDKTINQFFEEQVSKNPDHIAVTYAGTGLTYFALNEKSNKLANFIRLRYLNYYKTELSPETLIVISMERCLELVVAILAVIKAGGAYVPIDVNYPEKRKSFILEDTDAKLILIQEPHFSDFSKMVDDSEKILILEEGLKTESLENKNLQQIALPDHTVYVIYTSGSTGMPKGVCVTHLNLNNFISSVSSKINFTSKKILSMTSFTFDVFYFDFFGALCSGGTLILTDSVMVKEPNVLVNYIEENNPDIVIATPSLWHMIVDKLTPSPTLTILSAGEPLHENLINKLFRVSADVWDAYGPTEATIFSIFKRLAPTEQFSIGKPIPNVTAYILNENLQPVPIGVVGELYIGGGCLAKGYLNRPDLTKERFINNPFASEDEKHKKINLKIYKTGDLVCLLPSGDIRYIGRNDFQVKISGHRIELEELEFTLNQFPKLKQCFVLTIKSEMSMRLVVYYTAENKIEESVLRDHLAKSLPPYMTPHVFIYLEKFPVNNNGKIDINSLPKLNQINLNESIILPRNKTENELKKIITSVLNINSFSIDKNIFDMGCDSLKAVQVQTKINNHFNSNIKVADIFYYSTIEKLALLLSDETVEIENPYININNTSKVAEKDGIAIIGYSCSFPMSDTVEEYWNNIKDGKECVRKLEREECVRRGVSTDILNHDKYSPYAGVVSNIEMFDLEFWGLTERDALFMDPKMRLFLEQAWIAIENSGYIKKRKQISMGLFASFGKLDYLDHLLQLENIKNTINYFDYSMLTSSDYFVNRIAHLLGVNGPLLSIDTACSSASVSVIEACEKLLAGKCDFAIVGGVNLCSAHDLGHIYFDGVEVLSKDGHSRIFDEKAGGIVRSDGVGVVVLKRLSEAVRDQDHIKAVIKGYGVSYDGVRKFGNMYPRLSSLKKCISDAQQNLDQQNIDYVECHGMGFKLGEIFEFDALKETVKPNNIDKCVLGSVKANIGHTGYASGMAQLIKLACMLEYRTFPPQINYENPYTEFNLDNEPFQINKEGSVWQKNQNKPKMAAMTSFGIGGTNAHLILEEAPNITQARNKKPRSNFLISLSAKSNKSLMKMKDNLSNYLASHHESNMTDVEYTLHLAREEFNHRLTFVCHDTESCIKLLQSDYSDIQSSKYKNHLLPHRQQSNLIFYYPDVIDNPTTISKTLYETESIYRDQIDQCAEILKNYLGVDIREVILGNIHNNLSDNVLKQSTYFACISLMNNYAISRFLQACGLIKTHVLIGEGSGEYLSACLAGVISLDDMFKFFLMRESQLTNAQVKIFAKSLQDIQANQPNIPCLSWRTGEAISIKTLLNEANFKKGLNNENAISKLESTGLISSNVICITFGNNTASDNQLPKIVSMELRAYNDSSEINDYAHLLNLISQLWLQGVSINWEGLYLDKAGTLIDLPSYSFEKIHINIYQKSENYESQPIHA